MRSSSTIEMTTSSKAGTGPKIMPDRMSAMADGWQLAVELMVPESESRARGKSARRKGFKMSKAARAKISAAQKARWAKSRNRANLPLRDGP